MSHRQSAPLALAVASAPLKTQMILLRTRNHPSLTLALAVAVASAPLKTQMILLRTPNLSSRSNPLTVLELEPEPTMRTILITCMVVDHARSGPLQMCIGRIPIMCS